MKRIAVAFITALTVAASLASSAAHDVPASLAQGRDLSKYDDGGVYRGLGYIADVERLREFIWNHWTQKRRGYVQIVFQDVDTGTKAYLFIEPFDEQWRIYWHEISYSALGGDMTPSTRYPTIVTVERCRGSLIFFDADNRIVKYL